jgi:LacI family transcriptional regulator
MRRIEPRMVKDIRGLGIPLVAVDHSPRLEGIDSIEIDNRRGGALAAEHLAQLGHERIGMFIPRHPPPSVEERFEGFRLGLDKRDLKFSKATSLIVTETLTYEAGYQAALAALGKSPLTGFFCSNDEMAAGVLRAAHELGLRVPKDLSVVGFDDITMSNYTDPPLTTVGVVKEHMGRRAMARLIELVEQTDDLVKVELAPVEVVVRSSTGVARERSSRRG